MTLMPIGSVGALEDRLSEPSERLIESMAGLDGDIIILGVGGKMGVTLAQLAARADEAAGKQRRIVAVSSFSRGGVREQLEAGGISTVQANLLEPGAVAGLPDATNVVYMVGRKFGSTGAEQLTWATNVYLPGLVGERYADSRIVSFSTGCVYPLVPIESGGSTEDMALGPVGEYAMSCVGRERILDYYAVERGAKVLHYRLNYAVELRYGVLVDIALSVWRGEPIDLAMGHFNCVWQGYANAVALQCFDLAASPSRALNVTGPECVSVRWASERFATLMDKTPKLVGEEAPTAWLSNASECHRLFGPPEITLHDVMEWVATWIMKDGELLDKPTHFTTRDGKY